MIFFFKNFADIEKSSTFAQVLRTASRGGAVVARWAHNPKVGGSIPSPATFKESKIALLFLFQVLQLIGLGSPAKVGFTSKL